MTGGRFQVVVSHSVIFDRIQSMPVILDTQTFLVFDDMDTR